MSFCDSDSNTHGPLWNAKARWRWIVWNENGMRDKSYKTFVRSLDRTKVLSMKASAQTSYLGFLHYTHVRLRFAVGKIWKYSKLCLLSKFHSHSHQTVIHREIYKIYFHLNKTFCKLRMLSLIESIYFVNSMKIVWFPKPPENLIRHEKDKGGGEELKYICRIRTQFELAKSEE